ncbi:MAG: glucose-6-phosphate isomerase [Bacteroidales bacterium]|nr:glucose-6-phosphate isomerase [Bacteroidales bacterium]
MEKLKINIDNTFNLVSRDEVYRLKDKVQRSLQSLYNRTGKGNDFLGWIDLPSKITNARLDEIEATAKVIRKKIDVIVVVGIGGSYLGSKAIAEALSDQFALFRSDNTNPHILFAGHNLGEDYHSALLKILDTKRYAIVVISKSGTTTEPAVAFRILKRHLEKKEGKEESKNLIVAITDEKQGALRRMSVKEGYKTYVIPDNIGGRYSVLTPVGLVPLAIAGFDIRQLVKGAESMQLLTGTDIDFNENIAALYAAVRYLLYTRGKKIEILANFESKLHYLAEWWKQLYGESEGKENRGIFPAGIDLTTDLHSMGQYVQEGERIIFETVLSVCRTGSELKIPVDDENLDGLNYLAGKRIDEVNKMAELGTILAHTDGGVPNIRIEIPRINEYHLGQLMYFFEIACGISGYLLEVNPFDQPGVEAYKRNMFALLDKPGFENESKKIKSRIQLRV